MWMPTTDVRCGSNLLVWVRSFSQRLREGACIVIKLPDGAYESLVAHLLPDDFFNEQAAFLFAVVGRTGDGVVLDTIDSAKLVASDFEVQAPDYLELADATRARLFKRAHDLAHRWSRCTPTQGLGRRRSLEATSLDSPRPFPICGGA